MGVEEYQRGPGARRGADVVLPHATRTRILIADDHLLLRDGVRRLLESQADFEVVGEASDGYEAVRLAKELKPCLVLLDLSMPGWDGLEALRELTHLQQSTKFLIMTGSLSNADMVKALKLGASGVLLKASPTAGLFEAIRAVMRGQYWIEREGVSDLVRALRSMTPGAGAARPQAFGLTPREGEVVSMVVAGYSNPDIAQRCHISEQTVKHHVGAMFDKLGVSNRLELALFAVKHNLCAPLE